MKKNRIKLVRTLIFTGCLSLTAAASPIYLTASYAASSTVAAHNVDITPPAGTSDISTYIKNKILAALTTHDTIRVTGNAAITDPNAPSVEITIPNGKKIIWEASLSSNSINPILSINSQNDEDQVEFEFAEGSLIAEANPCLVFHPNKHINLKISGGKIIQKGNANTPAVIFRGSGSFNMSGGRIINYAASNPALLISPSPDANAPLNISGGVLAANGNQNTANLENGGNSVIALSLHTAGSHAVTIDASKTSIIAWDKYEYDHTLPAISYVGGGYDSRHLSTYPGSSTTVSWIKNSNGLAAIKYTNPNGESGAIEQQTAAVENINFPTAPANLTYDKTEKGLNDFTAPDGSTVTFKYEGINGTNYALSPHKPKDAGEYKVSAALSNFYGGLTVNLGTLKINKRPITLKVANQTINKDSMLPALPQSFADFSIENLAEGDNNQDALNTVPDFSWNTDGHTAGTFSVITTSGINYKSNYMAASQALTGALTVVDHDGTASGNNTAPGNTGKQKAPGKATPSNPDKATPSNPKPNPSNPSKKRNRRGSRRSGSGSSTKNLKVITKTTQGTWIQDSKGWWFKETNGSYPKSKWLQLTYNNKNDWYYFDEQGYMVTGWRLIDGKWYYLYEKTEGSNVKGAMAYNTVISGYRVGSNGAWIQK